MASSAVILVVGLMLAAPVSPDNVFLEQWYQQMSDASHECPATSLLLTKNDNSLLASSPPLFVVADDCSEPDARWDYNFVSKIKVKKGGRFEGKGKILVPVKVKRDYRAEHNNFKFGFKHNKCLKFYRDGISRIQGNFVNDLLEGQVKVDFLSGGFLLGQARRNRLVGVVRYFDDLNRLQNITVYSTDHEEAVTVTKNKHGMFRFSPGPRSSRGERPRSLFTRDFAEIHSCVEESDQLLRDCYVAKEIVSEIEQCNIRLEDRTERPAADSEVFSWNLASDEKFYRDEEPYAGTCSGVWTSDGIQDKLKDWIETMNDPKSEPFWREDFPDSQPFGDGQPQPELLIEIPEYRNRQLAEDASSVNISTSNAKRPLAAVAFNNGRFELRELSREQRRRPEWHDRLSITQRPTQLGGAYFRLPQDESKTLSFGMSAYIRRGRIHGNIRRFGRFHTAPGHFCHSKIFEGVSYVGRFDHGRPSGPQWRFVIGGGALYGLVDERGEFTGDDIAYIYPDMLTALVGRFENGVMVAAQESEVTAVRCEHGILQVRLTQPRGTVFAYKMPTNESYGDQPHVVDPLDARYMYIKQSEVDHKVADEGAFAKVDIPKGTVLTLYTGLNLDQYQLSLYNNRTIGEVTARDESAAQWPVTKYHGSVPECSFTITIRHTDSSRESFQAGLGHKLNHSFHPNSQYGGILDSPRFGLVRAFYANRDIKKDEELFIAYGYPLATGPPWYKELYNKTVAKYGKESLDENILKRLTGEWRDGE